MERKRSWKQGCRSCSFRVPEAGACPVRAAGMQAEAGGGASGRVPRLNAAPDAAACAHAIVGARRTRQEPHLQLAATFLEARVAFLLRRRPPPRIPTGSSHRHDISTEPSSPAYMKVAFLTSRGWLLRRDRRRTVVARFAQPAASSRARASPCLRRVGCLRAPAAPAIWSSPEPVCPAAGRTIKTHCDDADHGSP